MLRVLAVCSGLLISAAAAQAAAIVGVSLNTNGLSFGPGNTIAVTLSAHNIGGPALTGDFYFGIIYPDGVTATFIVPGGAATARLDADPRTWPPYQANLVLPPGFDVTIPNFYVVTVPAGVLTGNYRFFAAFTAPHAFANGAMEQTDFIMLNTSGVTVTSSPTFVRR
jgi:hypothetical protein